jgi:hypothetical protein
MKHFSRLLFYTVLFGVLVTSCSDDDDDFTAPPVGDYDNGYFILHEGGGPITPVTFVGEDGTIESSPFESVNPDADPFGGFNQDLFFSNDLAFIISGQASTVTVVNRFTLELVTTVETDFQNPRYGVVLGDRAYVTNSGDFGTTEDDFLTVINLNDYSTSTVVIGRVAERIETLNDKLYITNGSFGSGNSLTVLNPSNLNSPTFVEFGDGNSPNSIQVDGGSIFVLTSSFTDNGIVFEINPSTDAIASSINIPATLASPRNLAIDGGTTYFTNETSVYAYDNSDTTISDQAIMTYQSTSAFGAMYGFAVRNDVIYIADAGDFASNGTAFEYDTSGNLIKTIVTDVAPNSFHFN